MEAAIEATRAGDPDALNTVERQIPRLIGQRVTPEGWVTTSEPGGAGPGGRAMRQDRSGAP